jgi:hypothetical protein
MTLATTTNARLVYLEKVVKRLSIPTATPKANNIKDEDWMKRYTRSQACWPSHDSPHQE